MFIEGELLVLTLSWSFFSEKGHFSQRLGGMSTHFARDSLVAILEILPPDLDSHDCKTKIITSEGVFWTWLIDLENHASSLRY